MAADDWNYLAGRLIGDGEIEIIADELPLVVTELGTNMSAPSVIAGSITNRVKELKGPDGPIFQPWKTVIIAEFDGFIQGMGIYQKPSFSGASWSLDCVGLTGYPAGQPYVGEKEYVDTDPLDIFREMWANLQAQPGGNLGITIDDLKSPVRVGTTKTDVEFATSTGRQVSFEAGPRKLNWYQTLDIGDEVDKYAKATPFDWLEQNSWLDDRPHCHIKLGYPIIGGYSQDTRLNFVYGDNLATEPSFTGGDYVNQVHVLGAGEGRDRIRGYAGRNDGRLRRAKTIEDTSIETVTDANRRAAEALATTRGELIIERLEVHDHPDRPLGAFEIGGSYPLFAETEWMEVDALVRIVGKSQAPDSDIAVFTVVRSAVV